MSLIRVTWALIMAFCVGFTFLREWNHERSVAQHGVVLKKHPGRETTIWISPMLLPLFLAGMAMGMLAARGWKFASGIVLHYTMELILLLSVYYVLLLVLLPLLRKAVSARACATLWVLPVFLYWFPHVWREEYVRPLFVLRVPEAALSVFAVIWGAGFLVVLGWRVGSHFAYRRHVLKAMHPVKDAAVLELWEKEQRLIERKKSIALGYSSTVTSPMTIGLFARTMVTLLPERNYSLDELQLIFRHELRHIQRRDVDTKMFFAFCQAFCWFNPLVWLAVKKAAEDLELSCDEMVLYNAGEGERRRYAELLLDTAGDGRGFTTCLSASAKVLRYRLKYVMTHRRRFSGVLLLAGTMAALVLCTGFVAVSSSYGTMGSLLLPEGEAARIKTVRVSDERGCYTELYAWDETALLDYLSALPVTRVGVGQSYTAEGEGIFLTLDTEGGFIWLDISEGMADVFVKGEVALTSLYRIDTPLDWDHIHSCLDYAAPDPDPAPVRPELMLWFDGVSEDEPIHAGSKAVQIHDVHGTRIPEQENVSWSGVHGFAAKQVTLEFSYPPEYYAVWVEGLNGEQGYSVEGEEISDGVLELAPYSARYTVQGFFSGNRNTDYDMEFYFEVVFPE